MKKLIFLGVITLLFYNACKKDSSTAVTSDQEINKKDTYFPMKVGNYWVYEIFEVDTSGNETVINRPDSIYIAGDTIINGEKYFIFKGPVQWWGNNIDSAEYKRDSCRNIVDNYGIISLSNTNFSDTLYSFYIQSFPGDTLFHIWYKMENIATPFYTKCGNFDVVDYRGTMVDYKNRYLKTQLKYPRYIHHYYAKNIGLVMSTSFFALMPGHYEERLVRYNVE